MQAASSSIPHNRPTVGPGEEEAAIRVLRSGWLAQGREVEAFEDAFCAFLGLSPGHAVAVSSGTAALYLALWALGARNGKVAFPAYACSSLRHAVAMAGGIERLMDIADNGPNLDLAQLANEEADIAIVPHMYGLPSDLTGVDLPVIEDCAQSLGASIHGVPAGLQGTVGIYSFYATKLMTSGGQGGMIVSGDMALIESIRDYRAFDQRTDHQPRFNFHLTELQAAIGREQLKRLPRFIERRETLYQQYRNAGLSLMESALPGLKPVRYRAILNVPNPGYLIERLSEAGICAINPLEEWELLGEPSLFPNARQLTQRTVSLPLYPTLSDEEHQRVITGVQTCL